MPCRQITSRIALVCAIAIAASIGGCKNATEVFQDQNDGGWLSKPIFQKPEWSKPDSISKTVELGPKGPVGPDDLVSADGRCSFSPQMAQAAVPKTPADRPVGSMAGDLAGVPMPAAAPAGEPGVPQVMGGVALGMTECQTVQRAGSPGNVAINAGDRGERSVVLTYLSGPWPGIYRFSDGRLKVIDRAPVPPEQPKAPPKKKPTKKPVKKPAAPQ